MPNRVVATRPILPVRPPVMAPDRTAVALKRPAPFVSGLQDVSAARDWKPGQPGLDGGAANAIVNATYTRLDAQMSAYLGSPAVPNWMSFGKFASREAGGQLLRMEELLKATYGHTVDSALDGLQDFMSQPAKMGKEGFELLKFSKTPGEFLRNVQTLHDALVFGNTGVYADIAPAYEVFLRAEGVGQDGVAAMKAAGFGRAPRDPQGFLLQAFTLYQRAKLAGERAQQTQDPALGEKLLASRRELAGRANLLLGIHEQMIVLQGPQVFGNPQVAKILTSLSSTLQMEDALGTRTLLPHGGNWAVFADRMGFIEVPAGSDPSAVPVIDHEGLTHHYIVQPDAGQREGTISQYFLDGLVPANAEKLVGTTPTPLPDAYRDGNDMQRWLGKAIEMPGKLWDSLRGRGLV